MAYLSDGSDGVAPDLIHSASVQLVDGRGIGVKLLIGNIAGSEIDAFAPVLG